MTYTRPHIGQKLTVGIFRESIGGNKIVIDINRTLDNFSSPTVGKQSRGPGGIQGIRSRRLITTFGSPSKNSAPISIGQLATTL